MKHGKLLKTFAALTVFTVMGASLAACGDTGGNEHNLTRHDAVSSTCTQEGNIEYWDCSHCDKLFADAEGKQEITNIVEQKKPHTIGDNDYHAAVAPGCEQDGILAYWECESCHGKFSNKDGTKELTDIVDPAAHTPASHSKVEPTFTTPGRKPYWTCDVCGKFFLTEAADTPVAESETVIPALGEENVEVNVTVKDKTGATVSDTSDIKVKLVLQNAPFDYTYGGDDGVGITDDKLDLDKIGAGTYKVTGAEGYYNTTLTVEKGATSLDLVLEEIEHIGHNPHSEHPEYLTFESVNGEHRMVFNAPWDKTKESNAVYVDVQDDAIAGENYMADFTVRADYRDTGWTSRFYVAVADATGNAQIGYGFIFGNDADKLIMVDMTGEYKFGEVSNESKLNGQGGRYDGTAMVDALQTEQGLKLRVIRNGKTVTFYTATSAGYVAFRTLTLAGDYGARLAFAATANETITFSNVSVASYVAPVYNTDTVVLGHYVKGDKVYTISGEETTLEALEISKLEHCALTLKAGETPIAQNTNVKLVNADLGETIEAKVGENGVVTLDGKVYSGLTYTLTVDGYVFEYTFTVSGAEVVFDGISDSYTQASQVTLDRHFEYGGLVNGASLDGTTDEQIVLKTNGWPTVDQVVLNTTDTLKNADVYTVMFNWKVSKLEDWAGNRFGIRVTDASADKDIVGFYVWVATDKQTVSIGHLTGNIDFNRDSLSNNQVTSEFKEVTALTGDMLLAGADFKIEYNMGVATLFVNTAGENDDAVWTKLYETNVSGKPQVAFAAGNASHTYTDVAIKVLTPEKLETVALTLKDQNGDPIASGKNVKLTGKKGDTVTGTVGENGVVTLTGDNKVYDLVDYTVEVDGSATKLTVRFNGATAELEGFVLPQLIDSVALTLKAGTTPVATGKKVTLTSDLGKVETTVGADGVVTLTGDRKVYDLITYTVKVEGYAFAYDVVFTGATAEITEFEATVNWEYSDPAKTSVIDGSGTWTSGAFENKSTADKIAFEATHYISKEIAVDTGEALAESDEYTLYFTMKATSVTGWVQRIGIRVVAGTGDQTVGFFLYHKDNGEIYVGSLLGKIDFDAQGNSAVVKSALNISMFANGLDMKAERKQNSATLYARIGGTWTPINTVKLTGVNGALGFSASAGSFELTNVALDVKPLVDRTLSLTLKDGDGDPLAEGTSVSLTDYRGTTVSKTTDAQGKVTLETPYLGDYRVEVNGTMFVVNFSADSLAASKTISEIWKYEKAADAAFAPIANKPEKIVITPTDEAIDINAEFTSSDQWIRDEARLQTPESFKDVDKFILKFTITANFTGDYTERFGFRLTESTEVSGFNVRIKGDSASFGVLSGNQNVENDPNINDAIPKTAFVTGVEFVIIRDGNSATLYAKLDGNWTVITSVALEANKKSQVGFVSGGGQMSISDISIVTVTDTVAE